MSAPGRPRELLVMGAGGAAREVAAFAAECRTAFAAVAFVEAEDAPTLGSTLAGLPVLNLREATTSFPQAVAIIAIGNASLRRCLAKELDVAGVSAATLIHRSVGLGHRVEIGEGTILAPGAVITSDVRIGRHVYINIGCTISHDTVIEDFVTLSPGASVPGSVHLEAGAFVGTGASFVHGFPGAPLRIGREAVVGAGACVARDVDPFTTVVGVPARPLRARQTS